MRLFRTLYTASLLVVIASLGFVTYLVMTPLTVPNADSRISALCTIGNAAAAANMQFALTSVKVAPVDCACLASRLAQGRDKREQARLADLARALFVSGMRARLSGGDVQPMLVSADVLRVLQAFFAALPQLCAVKS